MSPLTPVAMPIAMQPMTAHVPPVFGRIGVGHAAYAAYGPLLRRTTGDHFAQFVTF